MGLQWAILIFNLIYEDCWSNVVAFLKAFKEHLLDELGARFEMWPLMLETTTLTTFLEATHKELKTWASP